MKPTFRSERQPHPNGGLAATVSLVTVSLVTVSLAVAALVAATPAAGLTMQRASLYSLSKNNSTILTGKVVDAYSYWNDDGTWIVTDYRVSPTEVIKGTVEKGELTLTMLGGRVGETTVLIPGAPNLEIGKSYLLFVRQVDLPGAARSKTLTSYTQSVFDILPTKDGPRALSQARNAGLLPDTEGKTTVPGGGEGLALATLLDAIRAVVEEPSSTRSGGRP